MKERPILFSGPMVRAILDGRKTQTRRLVNFKAIAPDIDRRVVRFGGGWGVPDVSSSRVWASTLHYEIRCPYGVPGDRLWVRETWQTGAALDSLSPDAIQEQCLDAGYSRAWAPLRYAADGGTSGVRELGDFGGTWGRSRPSIHMPRWASRLTLEVTEVRVQRLQEISEEDAAAEGMPSEYATHGSWEEIPGSGRRHFAKLWDEINGKRAPWASNPWVWAITFRRVQP